MEQLWRSTYESYLEQSLAPGKCYIRIAIMIFQLGCCKIRQSNRDPLLDSRFFFTPPSLTGILPTTFMDMWMGANALHVQHPVEAKADMSRLT